MDYSTFVSQRLREVNAQWDKEPLPDDGRQKFIEFKQVNHNSINTEEASILMPVSYDGTSILAIQNNINIPPTTLT